MTPVRRCRTCVICKKRYSRINNNKRKFMTKFPIDEDRCRQWVKNIGNEDLVYIPIEKLHEMKYVCGDHFQLKDFNKKKNRLKKWAVPSLLINVPHIPDYLLAEFPCHIAKSQQEPNKLCVSSEVVPSSSSVKVSTAAVDTVQHDHNCHLQSQERNRACPAPSSSSVEASTAEVDVVKHDHNYDARHQEITQDCPASSSSPVEASTTEVDVVQRDHNYFARYQDLTQDCLGPSSSSIEISTVEVDTVQHYHNCLLQSQERTQYCPAHSSSSAEIATAEVDVGQHDHNCHLHSQERTQDCPDLTPRKKKLLKKLQTCRIKLRSISKKFKVIESIDSPVLKTLITSTVKNQDRKHQARRWSNSDKGLALSIYKKSPKAYRFLRHMMPLPSIRTLQTILHKMTLEPGVNDVLLEHLRKSAQTFKEEDKICVILFDEMALKKRLILNTAKDKIEGYEDLGEEGRTTRVANHALVFMMQGLRKNYKQPLAHYFVQGTISTDKLTVLLKNVIRKVTAQGFTVIATVCDQGPTNIGALNSLKRFSGNNAESSYFVLDDRKIYTIYDVPHLFKSIRNNFLQAGEIQWEHKKAKWRHLIQLEEKNKETLHFTKITKRAVQPKYKGKMKVKLAAQILSNTVAAVLKLLAECSAEEAKKELFESAEIIQDLDHLFDVTNGPASYKDIKKNSRENVKANSFHHEKWRIYKEKLKSLKFLKNGKTLHSVRCVKGFQITLQSLQDIWRYLHSRGFKYMNLRQLNQDALENLFGLIRQHSPTNRNPTCHHFTAALKSSILTRMSTPVSRGGNCEQDGNNIMFDFHEIVFGAPDVAAPTVTPLDVAYAQDIAVADVTAPDVAVLDEEDAFNSLFSIPDTEEHEEDLVNFDNQPVVYVSGFLAKKMLVGVTCNRCREVLQAENKTDQIYTFISLKEWDENPRLTYPSVALCNEVKSLTNIFEEFIKGMLHVTGITQYSQTIMLGSLNKSWLCLYHYPVLSQKLVHLLSLLLIRNECRKINESFSLSEDNSDDILKKAQQGGTAK